MLDIKYMDGCIAHQGKLFPVANETPIAAFGGKSAGDVARENFPAEYAATMERVLDSRTRAYLDRVENLGMSPEVEELVDYIRHGGILFFSNRGESICYECGGKFHWIDGVEGGIEEKWESFMERYCGC